MGEDVLVPMVVFGSMALIFWIIFSQNTKKRAAELETVRAVVDKTGELTPDLVQAIGRPRRIKNADLRKGLILLAIAGAFVGLGYAIPEDEAPRILMAIALFPGLVGVVYVLFHFMGGKDD